MLAKACACAVVGLEGALIEVEVDIGQRLPAFCFVGLPDAAVDEANERVRAAIKNSGGIFPMRRITDNLADLRKKGPSYDLRIAVAILMSSEQFPAMTATGEVVGAEGALPGRVESGREPAPYAGHPADGRAGLRTARRGGLRSAIHHPAPSPHACGCRRPSILTNQ
jgi:predicted ATPase with chaperone activity